MPDHIQITFIDLQPEQQELLIAHLSEAGFEGFEQKETELKAFIPEETYDKELLHELAYKYQLSFSEQLIPAQNWNAVWESNFQPVMVDDFVGIRADFHEPVKGVEHEIIITPKMSFGTGHHASTYMMVRQMREIDFSGKTVFDFGTGTGILAILAEKLGASSVVAVDNDEWSISNALENFGRNSCKKIKLLTAGFMPKADKYDIILANINKNVILENFNSLAGSLLPGAILLLSGLLGADEIEITEKAAAYQLKKVDRQERNNWISLRFNG
ncbi:MAG: 50S ribosomal protein L11 methyltransferase [Bacteroidota bacterium]